MGFQDCDLLCQIPAGAFNLETLLIIGPLYQKSRSALCLILDFIFFQIVGVTMAENVENFRKDQRKLRKQMKQMKQRWSTMIMEKFEMNKKEAETYLNYLI